MRAILMKTFSYREIIILFPPSTLCYFRHQRPLDLQGKSLLLALEIPSNAWALSWSKVFYSNRKLPNFTFKSPSFGKRKLWVWAWQYLEVNYVAVDNEAVLFKIINTVFDHRLEYLSHQHRWACIIILKLSIESVKEYIISVENYRKRKKIKIKSHFLEKVV